MSAADNRSVAPFGAISIFSAVSRAEHALDTFRAWRRARATARALAELTDQQLADVGLRRAEIEGVALRLARGR
jgi:uncharacterized protein YjiS (DUF1127 family)